MPSITLDEISRHDVELILPVDPEFADIYGQRVSFGRLQAKDRRVAFVAICRNAMPFLPLTLERVAKAGEMFKEFRCFIYENDSVDGTKKALATAAKKYPWLTVESVDNGRPHLNYTTAPVRTIALAEYRNRCREWVSSECPDYEYTIVFDTDPWGGFSIDGIANTLGHLEDFGGDIDDGWNQNYGTAAGMGSYSWIVWGPPVTAQPTVCHYDAFAFRLNYAKQKTDMNWFHLWHPVVGSPPVRVKSCFGQLAVYRTQNFLQGVYGGHDCEHVIHWLSAGGECYLNPSQRVVSFWIPEDNE